ncbi:hypothetical protein PV726_13940 [Streptomyces europaeiscabiei]|uniref:hypothetical protein n=1 Tax=Streptomyces europaeiscabiei TaxID=146819 RepID=UPI0029BE7F00|nr:hypothetical protein [Streptomyces europaeiscabiei]MDX3691417.1 hypothetical protein [Streptomyces europaeiscabiei]
MSTHPPQRSPATQPYLPPPPPQKKSRVGVVLGVVGGVMALLIVAWAAVRVSEVGTDGDFPEARYRLALPKTLLGGEYKREQDFSDSPQESFEQHAESALGGLDVQAAVAIYTPADRGGQLNVSGVYGRFKDADDARDTMLKDAATRTACRSPGHPRTSAPPARTSPSPARWSPRRT